MASPTDRVTIKHTPANSDVDPYTFTATRKAWDAGAYPRSQGFELVTAKAPSSSSKPSKSTSSKSAAPKQTAAQRAAEAQAEADAAAAAAAPAPATT